MGCIFSRYAVRYDSVPTKPNDFESVSLGSRRKPNEGEIQDLASSINMEPFPKDRASKLRKLDGIELSKGDVQMILRALKNDAEKVNFIKTYRSSFTGVQIADLTPWIRSTEKRQEVESLFVALL